MNERLNELADKSGFGRAWYDPTIPTSDIDHRWIDQRRLKEFAELIVKECMTMCDELQAQYLTSRKSTMDFNEKHIYAEGEAACDIIKYKMKKQFGVEE